MSCRVLRIDNQDLTTTSMLGHGGFGPPKYDSTREKIYFSWTCVDGVEGQVQGDFHAKGVYFRAFNVETETFDPVYRVIGSSTAFAISDNGTCDNLGYLWVPGTDEMMVFYGDAPSCSFSYSLDLGQNWSTEQPVTARFSSQGYLASSLSPTKDVYVWTQQKAGGAGQNDTYLWKRVWGGTLPNVTWISKGLFDDGTANSGIAPATQEAGAEHSMSKEDGTTHFVVFQRLETNADMILRCYWTTNDWGTINTTDIKSWASSDGVHAPITNTHPIVKRGVVNTGRNWVMWTEALGGTIKPYIAYTDDWGATWTTVGSPTDFAGWDWDESFDRGYFIDWNDNQYASVWGTSGLNNQHTAFTSSDPTSLASWTDSSCNVDQVTDWVVAGNTCGYALYAAMADFVHTKFFRAFNRYMPTVAPSIYNVVQYNLFIRDDYVPPPPPPPAPSSENALMFRRGLIQAEEARMPNSRRAPGSFKTWKKVPRGW